MTTRPGQVSFEVIPAVDVLGDEAVRLEQGDFARVTLRAGDPAELVRRFAERRPPRIHVVDLAAARSGGVRPSLVAALVAEAAPVPLQAAGGVRSPADALALVAAGAERVVVGSAAFAAPGAVGPYVDALGERLVVAVDVRDGVVAAAGWESSTGLDADEAVDLCLGAGVARLLCTAIERDGTMSGPNLELLARVRERSGLPVLAAGGIRSDDDLTALAELGLEGAVVGRALLEGRISLGSHVPVHT
jgi:phosphoribosylformimino-5-aminoimidazole carboxamide ribotide isomerase